MSRFLDELRAGQLSPTFGDGWLTKSAADLVRIAVVFAGFDRHELIPRLARVRSRGTLLNARTVERVMAEISDEHARREELALVVWYLAVTFPVCAECEYLMTLKRDVPGIDRASEYGNEHGTICLTCAASYLRPEPGGASWDEDDDDE